MAEIWGSNSYAIRKKVGCLIVKDGNIISDGYNGMPTGFENECEVRVNCGQECTNLFDCDCSTCTSGRLKTKPYVLHAESNAIAKLARSTNNSEGSTLYVTLSPCIECAKLIIQSGIKRVVYKEEYRDTSGIELLKNAGIDVKKI